MFSLCCLPHSLLRAHDLIILRLTVHDCRPSCQQFHSTNNIVIVRPNRRQGYVARVEGERRRGSSPEANHGERGRRLQDVPQVARLLGLQEKDVGARQQLCRPWSNDFPGNAVWVFRWVAVGFATTHSVYDSIQNL